jgi:hypothetical protein
MSMDPAQFTTLIVNAGLGAGILYVFYKYMENMNQQTEKIAEHTKALIELKTAINRLIDTQERFITAINILLSVNRKNNNLEGNMYE